MRGSGGDEAEPDDAARIGFGGPALYGIPKGAPHLYCLQHPNILVDNLGH